MAYDTNPRLPEVRAQAVLLVRSGWSIRKAAKHLGFSHCTVRLWNQRMLEYGHCGRLVIPTRSSRPQGHPDALPPEVIRRILALRHERHQCAEILQHRLGKEGISVSLSSVKRVLKRYGMRRFSRYKKWHIYPPRPMPEKPGILVEMDTVWDGIPSQRLCLYTLLDVCSRWAYAWPTLRVNTARSVAFLDKARREAPFTFRTIQSDHGAEFSARFSERVRCRGMEHRHSRIRRPTDNGHLERFNRTIQEQCLAHVPRDLDAWRRAIPKFLRYYNTERPHMGLGFKTPLEVVRSY